MYEYHVMGANGMGGMQSELDKRAKDGWELVTAYQEVGGGHRHMMIFKRPRKS